MPMRVWWCVLLLAPVLSGCVDDGEQGVFAQIFSPESSLDGHCGDAYKPGWDQQIILDVRLGPNASKIMEVTEVVVSASHHDGEELRGYDKDRRPDEDGCVAFPLRGEGGYFFLALGFREGSSQCYGKGQLGGQFSGDFDVAQGVIHVEQRGSC